MSFTKSEVGRFGLMCLAIGLGASCSGPSGLEKSDGGGAHGGASAGNGGASGAAARAGSSGMTGNMGDAGKSSDPDGSGGASGVGGAAGSGAGGGAAGASGNGGGAGAAGASGSGGSAGAAGHAMDGGTCATVACDATCGFGFKRDDKGCPTCQCNETRVSCPNDQCGPPPAGPQLLCLDGSIITPTCAEVASGGCNWGFAPCPPVVCPTLTCAQACPIGSHLDAKGCATCSCILPNECASYGSYELCHAHTTCEWLAPGCDLVALPKAGCFPKADLGCTKDADCTGQRHCIFRSVDTCPPGSDGGVGCSTCIEQRICF
jgi:hypothetical protein